MGIYRPTLEEENGETSRELGEPTTNAAAGPQKGSDNVPRSSDTISTNSLIQGANNLRLKCGEIVNHHQVQHVIIALIIINAVMMGLATFDFVTDNPPVDSAFEVTDTVFLVIFTVELAMQLIYHGYKLFLDGWLLFDFIIVILSWSFASLQIVRAFRIFRALRIVTRIETMRNLVAALFDIMPRLGAITALLLLIFYIFAVLFTQLFGDLELSGNYFTRLDYSLFTLFVMMTMEWSDVARECMHEVWWAWLPFVTFIMITGFIVFNLIIAVVCDAVAVIENKDDLEPDIMGMLSGMMSGEEEESVNEAFVEIKNRADDIVDNLANRVAFVLESQKEMLATLELLTRDHKEMLPRESELRAQKPQSELSPDSNGEELER